MLLTDSFLDYLLHERNYSKGTVEYYRADILELQRFGEEMLGDLTPLDVDAELVREWIASLMDKGLASNTINRKLSSIRTYYKFLLRRGKVAVDPLRKVTGPKKKKPLPVFLREGEMNRLLDDMDFGEGFEGCRDHMIVEMFYATGMRHFNNHMDLTPSDVDAELVREWIASLMDKGLASNTINRKLSSIRTYHPTTYPSLLLYLEYQQLNQL